MTDASDGVALDYDPAIYADTQDIKGTGFVAGTDDLHSISTAITALAGMSSLEIRKFGPDSMSNDSNALWGVELIDKDTGLIPSGSISKGAITVVVQRDRGGAGFSTVGITQIPNGSISVANGRISFEYYVDASEFMPGDVMNFRFSGSPTVTIGGTTYYVGQTEWTILILSYDDRLASGQFTHPDGVAEVDPSLTITVPVPTAGRHRLGTIWLELSALTQETRLRLKYRIGGDTTYREFWSFLYKPATMSDHLAIVTNVTVRQNVILTVQSSVAEGAGRAIDYEYSLIESRS